MKILRRIWFSLRVHLSAMVVFIGIYKNIRSGYKITMLVNDAVKLLTLSNDTTSKKVR